MLSLQSFLRKGVSLGYDGLNSNLKHLEDFAYHQVDIVNLLVRIHSIIETILVDRPCAWGI